MFNLDITAQGIISEALYGKTTFDMDELRDAVSDQVHEAADNACIYNSDCLDNIDRYSSHPTARNADDEADASGATYKPSQWLEAQQALAYYIARAVIEDAVSTMLDEVEAAEEAILEALAVELPDDHDSPEGSLAVSLTCPHGWAAHDREDEDGVHYWVDGQVDGCNALAVSVAGFWLSYCWEPKRYYSLIVKEAGRWEVQFGGFDGDNVRAERDDVVDHGTPRKLTKIICTASNQAAIDQAVAGLNA